MQDPNLSRIVTTNVDNQKVKKQIIKVYNDETQKYETVLQEIKPEPISVQIDKIKNEVNQNFQTIQKLKVQGKNLKDQLVELRKLLNEKTEQKKKEDKQNNQKQFIQAKNNLVEFQPVSYNTDERMKVLKQEIENAKKYNQYLKKESESNSKKGESIQYYDELKQINDQVGETKKAIQDKLKKIKELDLEKNKLEKSLQQNQNGEEELSQISALTVELAQLKTKIAEYEQRENQLKETFQNYEDNIDKYITALDGDELKNIEKVRDEYLQINVEERAKDAIENMKPKTSKEMLEEKKKRDEEKLKRQQEQEKLLKKKEEQLMKQGRMAQYQRPNKQSVKEIINEEENFKNLVPNPPNYQRLRFIKKDLKIQLDKKRQQHQKKLDELQCQKNEILMEINALQQKIKEKEREREMAENKHLSIKPLLKHGLLTPIQDKDGLQFIDPKDRPTNPKDLLESKKAALKKDEKKHKELTDLTQKVQVPFSFDKSKEEREKEKQARKNKDDLTKIEQLLDCSKRVAKRFWFGYEPTDQITQIRDDINVVGQYSGYHRIHKLSFYFNSKEGMIFGIIAEYIKDITVEQQSLVIGQWKIGKEVLDSPTTETKVIEFGIDDRIREIIVLRENQFISNIAIKTKKNDKFIIIGKEGQEDKLIEKKKEKSDKKQTQEGDKGEEKPDEKEEQKNPDRYHHKVTNQGVVVTLFSGFNPKTEKELGMTFFGFEVAQKLDAKERESLLKQKEEQLKLKELERKRKELEKLELSQLEKSQSLPKK
ncbi:hypothetical protein pb186bvf_014203 [Paramecium bursaria]